MPGCVHHHTPVLLCPSGVGWRECRSVYKNQDTNMANQESRVKKSLLNARVNLIFYFLTLALSFFSRKIFLDTLGADFVGLTTTLQNLLGFLNLAELGIGSAIGYVLYKPLFEHDEGKINEIISVFGYLYRWIGFIILGAGLVLGAFLPLIFPNTMFELGVIYFAYFAFLTSSLIGYFINYRQTLLGADQKEYVVNAYFQSANIIKVIIQMTSAWYTGSYYLWVVIELSFGILYSVILNWRINKTYPWLRSEVKLGKKLFKKYPEVMKYTKQLFVHKIGTFAQFQITPLLTYAFISLKIVAHYGNYTIIVDKLNIFLNTFLGSTGAGVGNLIAEGNSDKIYRIYWELFAVRVWFSTIVGYGLFLLLPPFIAQWLGTEYLLPQSVLVVMIVNTMIGITRGVTDQFIFGHGLFYDTWAPLAETIIYIVTAIIGGYFWGLTGILLGSTISLAIIIGVWKPYFLFSKGFKRPVTGYWKNFLVFFFWAGFAALCTHLLVQCIFTVEYIYHNWFSLIITAVVAMCILAVLLSGILLVGTQGMRDLLRRLTKHGFRKIKFN